MPSGETHMPVGLRDASYSPRNSLLLAQTDLANNILLMTIYSQCITWTLFPKIVSIGESKSCVLRFAGAISYIELISPKKFF